MATPTRTISLAEQLEQLKLENEALKATISKVSPISFSVTEAGKFAVAGIRKQGKPPAFTRNQWERFLAKVGEFVKFMDANTQLATTNAEAHAKLPKKTRAKRVVAVANVG